MSVFYGRVAGDPLWGETRGPFIPGS